MNKQSIIKELGKHRGVMPRQTLKTIRGQAIAGDLTGACKGFNREIRKIKGRRDEDCFAYKNKNSCIALKEKECDDCSFYKTREEFKLGQRKTIERIKTLDIELQRNIDETYYGGKLKLKGEI